MSMRKERLGGLQARITGGTDRRGGGEGPVIVLLHGFGAPGHDLVSLWEVLDAPPGTRFVFPEGPLALDLGFFEARAWWMLDLERIQRDLAAGRPRNLSRELPRGLIEARKQVLGLLDEVRQRLGAAPEETILGGFSQGAMLSCDVALHTQRPLAGLILLSATLLAREEWVSLMPKRRGLRVFQSHGREDPLLPFSLAEELRGLLSDAGLRVEWVEFEGAHEIPEAVIQPLKRFVRRALADSTTP